MCNSENGKEEAKQADLQVSVVVNQACVGMLSACARLCSPGTRSPKPGRDIQKSQYAFSGWITILRKHIRSVESMSYRDLDR
jgi:hypothetical protein